jgi:hypothetical protein
MIPSVGMTIHFEYWDLKVTAVNAGKAIVGLRPSFFGPGTLGRTWGTR